MRIRLSAYATVEAEEVKDVRVRGNGVSVRMIDGVAHQCPLDLGKDALATAERLAVAITKARQGQPLKPVVAA